MRKPHVREAAWQLRPEQHYADEKHAQSEDLDDLPPEVLSLVLSQLLPQDMLVQGAGRWRDKDLDVLYWKQLFLNTFALDPRDATPTTKRGRKATKARSREWRDRYGRRRLRKICRANRAQAHWASTSGGCSSADHRVRPTNVFHAIDGRRAVRA